MMVLNKNYFCSNTKLIYLNKNACLYYVSTMFARPCSFLWKLWMSFCLWDWIPATEVWRSAGEWSCIPSLVTYSHHQTHWWIFFNNSSHQSRGFKQNFSIIRTSTILSEKRTVQRKSGKKLMPWCLIMRT